MSDNRNEYKRRRMSFFDDMESDVFGTPRGLRNEEDNEDFEAVQCVNCHWTSSEDLDEDGYCSQCLVEGLISKEEDTEDNSNM